MIFEILLLRVTGLRAGRELRVFRERVSNSKPATRNNN